MIKLKDLLFEQEEEKKIHPLVSNWKHEKAQKYASVLIEKYGEPDTKGDEMLLWKDVELIDEKTYEYKLENFINYILSMNTLNTLIQQTILIMSIQQLKYHKYKLKMVSQQLTLI